MASKETSKKTSKAEPDQIADVAKPGSQTADPNSRPLVGRKPMIQDPMVNSEPAASDSAAIKPVSSTPRKIIAPLSDAEKADAAVPEVSASGASSEAATKTKETPAAEPKPDEAAKPEGEKAPEPTENEQSEAAPPASDDEAVVNAVAEQVGGKKKEDEANEAELQKQAEIAKLIESKKYFVRISDRHPKGKGALVAVIVIVVIAVGGLLAVDAGLFGDIALPFDIIPNL